MRSQRLGQTGTHLSIIPGCASFASCIDQSRAYAVKVDMNAIESTAQTLLAAGKGIDCDVMSRHMTLISQMGMGQALLSFSGETLPSTTQEMHSTLHPAVGRTTPDSVGRLSHLLTGQRLKGGLPPESVMPASGSVLGVPLHTRL